MRGHTLKVQRRMILFDSHFHFDPEESPVEFTRKCEAAGVARTLVCGGSLEDSKAAAEFAEAVPGCAFAAGVHPQEAAKFQGHPGLFKDFSLNPKFAAIGEIGLDYHYADGSREIQKPLMRDLLELAIELKKPAVVHCRDAEGRFEAYEDAFALLSSFAGKGGRFVLHCFTGSKEWAVKFAAIGAYFGVGGIITFKKAEELREMIATLPLDRLLLETDAPYLAPVPHRGKPNHPSLLPHTAKALAALKNMPEDEIANITFKNATSLFGA